ncbi:MAG TPA: cytochrome c maturation protein CcmE [Chloroflexi bacterium]|nr:cytochrome c maturation protein CcmE [Chloroflexota bacterium]
MAETSYQGAGQPVVASARPAGRAKFIIGGLILLAAVAYLIVSNLLSSQQYFITVDELVSRKDELVGRNIRISGAVIGDTIEYDGQTLSFTIAHVPVSAADIEDEGGLAEVLHQAVSDPNASRVTVVLYNEPMPDLLQNEAQAIVTGTLGEDGVFYADELLLKCPTRYEEAVPEQVEAGS